MSKTLVASFIILSSAFALADTNQVLQVVRGSDAKKMYYSTLVDERPILSSVGIQVGTEKLNLVHETNTPNEKWPTCNINKRLMWSCTKTATYECNYVSLLWETCEDDR